MKARIVKLQLEIEQLSITSKQKDKCLWELYKIIDQLSV